MLDTAKIHLKQSRMSYMYHLKHSLYNGWICLLIFFSSVIHALLPMFLKQHAARNVVKIYNQMKQHAHLRKMIKEVDDEIDYSDLDHSNAAAYESLSKDIQESQK